MELPQLQNGILAEHGDNGLVVTAVHSLHEGLNAEVMEQDLGITYPVTHDFEQEALRHYRRGLEPFPLNVVIDRDGTVVYSGGSIERGEDAVHELMLTR